MAILKLNCEGCHERFEADDDKVEWKFNDNWFYTVTYRVVYCPKCGCANYIDWIEEFRREKE